MNNLFYIVSLGIVGASFMVIVSPKPVYSVFWLVIAFINAAVMFILLGLDYIGLIFIIVYVGAIAILFLFVIMLIQQPNKGDSQDHSHFLPVGVSVIFLFYNLLTNSPKFSNPIIRSKTNIEAIGIHLYITYYELVLFASLVLLVAMIGAILLAKQPVSLFYIKGKRH